MPFGISTEKQHARPPARADELAEMVLQDHAGEEHKLGDYWRSGPAALIFLRHYG